MCGLIAFFTKSIVTNLEVQSGLDAMKRRGPDDEGLWQEDSVSLGHRRLAILDLDLRSSQPMHSICGRYVIVFNGEIYNFQELKKDLDSCGVVFCTTSDTEVILAMFAFYGEQMLSKLHGMFAFVIWDKVSKKAFAARDPYGIKPLYIANLGDNGLVLASSVKALVHTGLVSLEKDEIGVTGFWMLGSVPEPHTWYKDISVVPAGHCLWIQNNKVIANYCWHDVGDSWRSTSQEEDSCLQSFKGLQSRVSAALRESVKRHMVADVPVGIFLSGGIDSGALAGLMIDD